MSNTRRCLITRSAGPAGVKAMKLRRQPPFGDGGGSDPKLFRGPDEVLVPRRSIEEAKTFKRRQRSHECLPGCLLWPLRGNAARGSTPAPIHRFAGLPDCPKRSRLAQIGCVQTHPKAKPSSHGPTRFLYDENEGSGRRRGLSAHVRSWISCGPIRGSRIAEDVDGDTAFDYERARLGTVAADQEADQSDRARLRIDSQRIPRFKSHLPSRLPFDDEQQPSFPFGRPGLGWVLRHTAFAVSGLPANPHLAGCSACRARANLACGWQP